MADQNHQKFVKHRLRTGVRDKFFPVQSAEAGMRNNGGVAQDHLSDQTLLCQTVTDYTTTTPEF